MKLIHAVALDFDGCTAYEEIAESLAPFEHFFHTSYSHTSECPKGRVVIPLSRPATPEEWPAVWRGAFRLTGELADKKTSDPSRIFYVPACPPERANEARIEHRTGQWLDTDEMIRVGSESDVALRDSFETTPASPFGSFNIAPTYDETRVRLALEKIDWDDRDQWLKAGMALHHTGIGEAVYALWAEYSQRSSKFDPKAQRDTWEHFKSHRDKSVTLATLFHMTGIGVIAKADDRPARSELGLAERFLARNRDQVKFVVDENIFIVWDGHIWRRDFNERAVMERMIETVKTVQRDEVTALMGRDSVAAKATSNWAIKTAERHATIVAALKLVKVDPAIATDTRALDAGLHLLQVENGIVNLQTGALLPSSPEMLHTRSSNARYEGANPYPHWKAFLRDVTSGDIELERFLQRAVGYSLSGYANAQCLFFLYGLGANGKSVFLNLLRELAGTYATTVRAETFMVQQRSASGANPDIVAMQTSRLVCVTELQQGQRLDEAQIKSFTGGEETSARQLYGQQFTFTPRFKLWFAGNHRPKIRGNDYGFWRRMNIVPFVAQIPEGKRDPNLFERLKAELPGILAWAVEGYKAYARIGLRPPKLVTDEVEAYKSDEDVLGDWLAACCDFDKEGTASREELFASYVAHCNRVSTKPISNRAVYASLREHGLSETKLGGDIRGFRGIRLRGVPEFAKLAA